VVINENGPRKTITKLEAAVKQLVNKAASGDLRALQQLAGLVRSADEGSNESPTTVATTMAEVDQKVLLGVFGRLDLSGGGGKVENS
jgi:hypothetical protein